MGGPAGDKLIRIDMTNQTVQIDNYPEEWKLLGGRALSAKILLGPHLRGRKEPTDRRHQGGELRRQPGPAPDEARLPGHRGEGQAR